MRSHLRTSLAVLASLVLQGRLTMAAEPSNEIVLDDKDTVGVALAGQWDRQDFAPPAYGGTVLMDKSEEGKGDKSVVFTPTLPAPGYYEVRITWPAVFAIIKSFATNTRVTLRYKGGSHTVLLNQQTGGAWVSLGTYPFDAGTLGSVEISNAGTDGFVMADAVKFIPTHAPAANPGPKLLPKRGNDEFDRMRVKWADAITDPERVDESDPEIVTRFLNDNATTQLYWDTLNRDPNRPWLWPDLQPTYGSWTITFAYERLCRMSKAYVGASAWGGFNLRGNPQLRDDILAAIEWLHVNWYNEQTAWGVNWFDYEVAAPRRLNDIVCLLYPHLTPEQVKKYMGVVEAFAPDPTKCYGKPGAFPNSAANRAWMATVVALRAVLVKDPAKLAMVRDSLSDVFVYANRSANRVDGFYPDGSFVFHGHMAYTGAYGIDTVISLADILALLDGTSWQVVDPNRANLYRWIADSFDPIMHTSDQFGFVIGRALAQSRAQNHVGGYGTIQGIAMVLPGAPEKEALAFRRMIKSALGDDLYKGFATFDQGRVSLRTLALVKDILKDPKVQPREPLNLCRVFANMDRAVLHRPGWAFGLSLSSSRIATHECIWQCNKRGWYTGEGMVWLLDADQTRYSDNFWPTVDPYRLPGITVDVHPREDGGDQEAGVLRSTPWTGGAVLAGKLGAVGMDLVATDCSLTGRKSWFLLDEEVVCLGAGITSVDNRPIETIIENRKLNAEGDNTLSINGRTVPSTLGWAQPLPDVSTAHLSGNTPGSDIGFWFPKATAIQGLREARTGAWVDLCKNDSQTKHTRNYLTLWCDHGANPKDATYAYVMLPGKSDAQVRNYATKAPVEVVANTSQVQAVRNKERGITMANFWEDGEATVGPISCNRKASVVIWEEAGKVHVAASDPTQLNQDGLKVTLALRANRILRIDQGLTVEATSPQIVLRIDTAMADGKTFEATLSK